MARCKVLFIAASSRSGSTLIERILGEVPGVFSTGELRHLWAHAHQESRLCSCGMPLPDCPFWSFVLTELYGQQRRTSLRRLAEYQELIRTRHLPLLHLPLFGPRFSAKVGSYVRELERLYACMVEKTGAKVIVDSSKYPTYGWVLDRISSVDLFVLHLTRDPRATAYSSWRRSKTEPGSAGRLVQWRERPGRSSLKWATWNWFIERTWEGRSCRYNRIRYEDLARYPKRTIRSVLDFLDLPAARMPFVDEQTVWLGRNHSAAGNPDRFEVGEFEIRPDEEWRSAQPVLESMLVTAITLPLLRKYGYSVCRRT